MMRVCRRWSSRVSSRPRPPPLPGQPLDLNLFRYVDKTRLLSRILSDIPSFNSGTFLHAPAMRRIGKSTVINMLAAMARGEKHLFEGMAVEHADSPFRIGERTFSVIQLDFSGCARPTMSELDVEKCLSWKMSESALLQHGIHNPTDLKYPSQVLAVWLRELRIRNGHPVVLLIDEYAAPISSFLPYSPDRAQEIALMLKPFYETIKNYGECFHKVFITGMSKFSSTSMFSGANPFLPLMERTPDFACLYGFTDREIRETYGNYIGSKFEKPLDEVMLDMKQFYNGYRIHPEQKDSEMLYNPWSVLDYLDTGKLMKHWASSAGSASVISMLGLHGIDILHGYSMTQERLFANISAGEYTRCWEQMAFQSGYSTIKSSHSQDEYFNYTKTKLEMGVPNQEVREWLQNEMCLYIGNLVGDRQLMERYRTSILRLDIGEAKSYLEKMISSLEKKPTNETEFSAYALHSLRVSDKLLDMAFQKGIKLEEEDVSPGRYPTFDGALVIEFNNIVTLVVLELKCEAFVEVEGALNQALIQKYAERAKKLMEERNNFRIRRTICVALNLKIDNKERVEIDYGIHEL